ncbi:hypothetical protein NHX12_015733 [Muraenolepis orangiensis]|uniref:AIG1-type G domain-containing protein n=1 Tax=Muraenolepis orangiensis TaxID=630683 RepID=A0A9Q0F0J2_9TELE|nr:hypothetical protein NHX12_015733 [Muraenolepis orangiensis]
METVKGLRLAEAVKREARKVKGPQGALDVYSLRLVVHPMEVDGCRRFALEKTRGQTQPHHHGARSHRLGEVHPGERDDQLHPGGQVGGQVQIEHSLTIVDTPGFGDTRGIERDRMIIGQLENLFKAPLGVNSIDAICFVAQASLARLTPTQKYVFDSVLSIFGNNVADNIRILVTFADGKLPPVLTAIKESGAPCPKRKDGLPVHFKFNNSTLFSNNKVADSALVGDDDEDGEGNFDRLFWGMGAKSMNKFFSALNIIETKSLTLTLEVLRQRGQLENTIENLQKKVKLGLAKLEELNKESKILQIHNATITANGNFQYDFTYIKPVQCDISETGNYITNCQQCNYSCHYPCKIPNDAKKNGCIAMEPNGNCKICKNKCHWSVHFNQKYRWDYQKVTEKRAYKELKDKYQQATKEAMSVEDVMKQMQVQYNLLQEEVLGLISNSAQCLNRLKEIALKPNPLSTLGYIDLLIQGEKSEAKEGYLQRIQKLQEMRENKVTLEKVSHGQSLL